MSAFIVGRATEAQVPACLALLPEVRQLPAEFLVARKDGELAGAAAVMWRSWATPTGFPLRVQVLPELRRKGVGRRLVTAAMTLAAGETDGLWSLEPEDLDGANAGFLQACGFKLARRQHHFQAEVQALQSLVGPLVERLRARGRIPEAAKVVKLAEAPMDEVGWLVSRQFGGGPFGALQSLRERTRRRGVSTEDISLVVMDGDAVAAALLGRMDHGVAVIDARVVAPGARRDWPSALQLDGLLRRGVAQGVREFRFHCDDDVIDTLNLARRCGARDIGTKGLFYYALTAS